MIDDKKIEATARRNSDKYRNYPTLSDEDRDKVSIGSFMDCAKWMQEELLKSLWHPNSEEPRKGAKFLYQNHYNSRFYYYIDKIDDILETYPNWSSYVKHVRVIQWLYIEDLFPKEGGE